MPYYAKGWCRRHYGKLRPRNNCAMDGCEKPQIAKGFCQKHHEKTRVRKECKLDGCTRPERRLGWCEVHYQRARKNGGDPGPPGPLPPIKPKRPVPPIDHESFKDVGPQHWYWIGFLAADGCVGDKGIVELRLAAVDLSHIEALRAFVCRGENYGRINGPHKDGSYVFTCSSKQIAADLLRHGNITPRKTHTYDPGPIPSSQAAFWMGMLDGDGSVFWHINQWKSGGHPELIWSGTEMAMLACRNFWVTTYPGTSFPNIRRANGRTLWEFRITGSRTKAAAQLLLDSCPYRLPRKREKLEAFASAPSREPAKRSCRCALPGCSQEFFRYRSALKNRDAVWCSYEHYVLWQKGRWIQRVCSIEGCNNPHDSRGWCSRHYDQFRPRKKCAIEGCSLPHKALGYCKKHYNQLRSRKECTVIGCTNPLVAGGFCNMHYLRAKANNGNPGPPGRLREH